MEIEITQKTQKILDFLVNLDPDFENQQGLQYNDLNYTFNKITFNKILNDLEELGDINTEDLNTSSGKNFIIYITSVGYEHSQAKYYDEKLKEEKNRIDEEKKDKKRKIKLEKSTIIRNNIYNYSFLIGLAINIILLIILLIKN